MNEVDRKNLQILGELHNLGKIVYCAEKIIEEQKEMKEKALKDFRKIAKAHPKAKELYYSFLR